MKYKIWIASMERVSPERRIKAVEISGGAKAFYETSMDHINTMRLFQPKELEQIASFQKNQDPSWMEEQMLKAEIRFCSFFDQDYPKRLKHITQAPFGLFFKGELPGDGPAVSIVGARMCSEYGRNISSHLGAVLAQHGINVISGMALGVDSASHTGALKSKGKTYAVLGCGCDVIYPRSSRHIYENIIASGGVISEYCPGTQPLAYHFPQRNRIISGLSDAIIVVEAKEKSGSLITADFALEQGRDIYAVPGRLDDRLSKGCNRLIDQGAGIIYDVDEFLKNIGIFAQQKKLNMKYNDFGLEKEQSVVYSCLDLHPKFIGTVQDETGLQMVQIIHAVEGLQQKGLIREPFQNHYCRLL